MLIVTSLSDGERPSKKIGRSWERPWLSALNWKDPRVHALDRFPGRMDVSAQMTAQQQHAAIPRHAQQHAHASPSVGRLLSEAWIVAIIGLGFGGTTLTEVYGPWESGSTLVLPFTRAKPG